MISEYHDSNGIVASNQSSYELMASRVYMMASQVYMVASQVYMMASQVNIMVSQVYKFRYHIQVF